MTTFLICLDSKNDVFFADSEASGKIFLKTTEAETVRRVNVTIIGRAHVFFTLTTSTGGTTHHYYTIPFESEQVYISVYECLWERNESNQLSNGEHGYPFKFKIPSNAPANASERCGHVQYYVKAEIEYYGKYSEAGYHGFSVCPIINLNRDSNLKLPVSTVLSQTKLEVFSCVNKTLKVTISLPKTGFVCGEVIPLQIDISNKTSMKIKSLEYGIILKCLFTGNQATAYSTNALSVEVTLNVVTEDKKSPSDSAIYNIQIPPLSPNFTDCYFLKIEYFLFVKVHTSAICRSGPSTSIPITLGTVPILEGEENGDTVDAKKILKTADFMEGEARCEIQNYKRVLAGPIGFRPKFAYYSKMPSMENLNSE